MEGVICPFYFKIGACRHGYRCSRLHNKPSISRTLLFSNMYQRPDMITPGVDVQGNPIDPLKMKQHYEDFYEDLYEELNKYGEIESLNICDNLADHMAGNVYVLFQEQEQAVGALRNLQGTLYAGRPVIVDFSPVTDLREATCRRYQKNACNLRNCNFMHLRSTSRELYGSHSRRYDDDDGESRRRSRGNKSISGLGRSRSRSRSPGGRRDRSPVREGSEERLEKRNREKREQENASKCHEGVNDRVDVSCINGDMKMGNYHQEWSSQEEAIDTTT